ncbi:hypothetical protein M2281_003947 [Mesorhizobium soli]|uniref:hypothetical protein n=1 Tax=Pseudaminobacter soli (ex Li et al. 2025) TaxID=1295366 RepID=UPI002473489B|nr:hypothetical protein [Mesorhizobium soli]MDH6233336.1 hypothetical protein [Mesorhizobium soli]
MHFELRLGIPDRNLRDVDRGHRVRNGRAPAQDTTAHMISTMETPAAILRSGRFSAERGLVCGWMMMMVMMVMMGVLMMPGFPSVAGASGAAGARRTADISAAACSATAAGAHLVGRAACGTATDPGSQRRGHQSYRQGERGHNSHNHLEDPSSL